MRAVSRPHTEATALASGEPSLTHQPGDAVPAAALSFGLQQAMQAWAAVHLLVLLVELVDPAGQGQVGLRARPGLAQAGAPVVIAAA